MEETNRSLRLLLTGGDQLRKVPPVPYTVVNNYGPTECSVVASSGRVTARIPVVSIGRPIDNTRIYVMGTAMVQIQPVGIPGDVYLRRWVAKGYHQMAAPTSGAVTSGSVY